MEYPYNHRYTMRVSIGLVGAERTGAANPSKDSSYSEEEWNALTDEERSTWLNDVLQDWASSYIDMSITPD